MKTVNVLTSGTLPPWCFKSGCPGSMLWRPGFLEGLGKQGSRCCLKRLTPELPLGSSPTPDRMWLWAFQVWFLGKSPGCAGISTGETTGMVPGISYTPVCKCITWEAFLSSLVEPQGTESGTGASQRGAGQGDKSSRVLPYLFHLCLHLTSVGVFWRSNYTGTRSRWAFLVLPAHPLPTCSAARSWYTEDIKILLLPHASSKECFCPVVLQSHINSCSYLRALKLLSRYVSAEVRNICDDNRDV